MNKITFFALLFISIHVIADDSFQDRKAKWSANLENKIKDLQTIKSCVDNSTDHETLKKCQKDRKESLKEARKIRKERFKNKKIKK